MQCGMSKSEVNKAGTNEHIRESTKWFGTVEECVSLFGRVPEGAWIYIWTAGYNADYNDQLGTASHMGQLLDDGRVLNASYSNQKVMISSNRVTTKSIPNGGWNAVLLPKYIRFPDDIEQILGNTYEEGETMSLANKTCIVTGGSLKLRKAKSTTAVYLALMPEGAEVEVSADNGTWAEVSYTTDKGKEIHGYAMSEYLAEKDSDNGSAEETATVITTGSGVWIPTPTPVAAISLAAILKTAESREG